MLIRILIMGAIGFAAGYAWGVFSISVGISFIGTFIGAILIGFIMYYWTRLVLSE